ncbi:MAG: hypothetical protein R2697_16410 [Ilumatobacteraceae bacterium]
MWSPFGAPGAVPLPMEVAERIRAEGARLTVAERRVATAVLDALAHPPFGTVASRSAQVGASVIRLANKLGFDGYSNSSRRSG